MGKGVHGPPSDVFRAIRTIYSDFIRFYSSQTRSADDWFPRLKEGGAKKEGATSWTRGFVDPLRTYFAR